LRPAIESLGDEADVLLLPGDLTRVGTVEEAGALAGELRGLPVPMFGVLGNHDVHGDRTDEVCAVLEDAGVRMLLGESAVLEVGEPPEIWAFLGSYLLGEAVDRAGAELALHGHAHRGTERGTTPGGVPVRNVAQPVIRAPYRVYCLAADRSVVAAGDRA